MSPRTQFRQALEGSEPVFAPLCLDPLNARLIEQAGFGAGYLSGGALGFQYAVGEALLTYTEIAENHGNDAGSWPSQYNRRSDSLPSVLIEPAAIRAHNSHMPLRESLS